MVSWDDVTDTIEDVGDAITSGAEKAWEWTKDVGQGAVDVVEWTGEQFKKAGRWIKQHPAVFGLPLAAAAAPFAPFIAPAAITGGLLTLGASGLQSLWGALTAGSGVNVSTVPASLPFTPPSGTLTKEEKRFYRELKKLARLQRAIGAEEISYVKGQVWPAEERLIKEVTKPQLAEAEYAATNIQLQAQRQPFAETLGTLLAEGPRGSVSDAMRLAAIKAQAEAGESYKQSEAVRNALSEMEFGRTQAIAEMGLKKPGSVLSLARIATSAGSASAQALGKLLGTQARGQAAMTRLAGKAHEIEMKRRAYRDLLNEQEKMMMWEAIGGLVGNIGGAFMIGQALGSGSGISAGQSYAIENDFNIAGGTALT